MSLSNGQSLASVTVHKSKVEESTRVVLNVGVSEEKELNKLVEQLTRWFEFNTAPLERLEQLRLWSGGRFERRKDGSYELVNYHPSYSSLSIIRGAVELSLKRNSILEFGYRGGGVGAEHRHQVNILRVHGDGFLARKHSRIRSYLWRHVQWACVGLEERAVTQEWAIVVDVTAQRRDCLVTFTLAQVGSGGRLCPVNQEPRGQQRRLLFRPRKKHRGNADFAGA